MEEIWIRFSQFGSLWCSLILPKWDECKLCINCWWTWSWGDVEFLGVFIFWNLWFVLCLWNRISLFSSCWHGICCMNQKVLKSVANLLPLLPEFWDYRCTQPRSSLASCSFIDWNVEPTNNRNLLVVQYHLYNSEKLLYCKLQCLFVLSIELISLARLKIRT